MIEAFLTIVILGLLGYIGYSDNNNRKERTKLTNLIIAKTNQEAVNLTLADQTKIEPAKAEGTMRDLVEANELSDEEFDTFIQKELNNQN